MAVSEALAAPTPFKPMPRCRHPRQISAAAITLRVNIAFATPPPSSVRARLALGRPIQNMSKIGCDSQTDSGPPRRLRDSKCASRPEAWELRTCESGRRRGLRHAARWSLCRKFSYRPCAALRRVAVSDFTALFFSSLPSFPDIYDRCENSSTRPCAMVGVVQRPRSSRSNGCNFLKARAAAPPRCAVAFWRRVPRSSRAGGLMQGQNGTQPGLYEHAARGLGAKVCRTIAN